MIIFGANYSLSPCKPQLPPKAAKATTWKKGRKKMLAKAQDLVMKLNSFLLFLVNALCLTTDSPICIFVIHYCHRISSRNS